MNRLLVDAMLDDPDSDAVAAAIADSFSVTDPPRAEICRLDIHNRKSARIRWLEELRGHAPPADPDISARYERRNELFDQHGSRWMAELPGHEMAKLPGHRMRYWEFQYGVWTHTYVTTTWLREHGAELFATQPITRLSLDDCGGLANALELPYLRHLRSLSIRSSSRGTGNVLATATTLTQLETLDGWLDENEVMNALESPTIRAVESFTNNGTQDLEDIHERLEDGTTKIWRGQRGLKLENRYGPMRWLHKSRWRGFPGTRAFGEKWLAQHASVVDDTSPTYAGTYRHYEFTASSLSDPEFEILQAAGYRENGGLRRYAYSKDGGPGWAGWIYFVGGIEFSDALWIDQVAALRR